LFVKNNVKILLCRVKSLQVKRSVIMKVRGVDQSDEKKTKSKGKH